MIKFAVISFPGTNCETETLRAFKRNGMEAEAVLWNDPGILSRTRLSEFQGYAIAGGFSYEDRGRSGVVAATDPIMEVIKDEADAGKIVLGICNGAQILVETGLVPGFDNKAIAMALSWNEMRKGKEIIGTGFYNAWTYLKNSAPRNRSAFNDFDGLLHIPFAHGEGRFMLSDELLQKLEKNGQILFKYCDEAGRVDPNFPITPNGATAAIAGLCNPAGNVMAIMPHPERDPMGNGNAIFQSIKRWIEGKKKADAPTLGDFAETEEVRKSGSFDLEVYVKLIITDNSERTIEEALQRKGYKLHLDRYEYFGINLKTGIKPEDAVKKIFATGELANFNKQTVTIKQAGKVFSYTPDKGMTKTDLSFENGLIAADEKDFVGEAKASAINAHAGNLVKGVQYGVLWKLSGADGKTMQNVIHSKAFYNPNSMYLTQV